MRLRRSLIPAAVAALMLGPVITAGTAHAAGPRHVPHVTYNPMPHALSHPQPGHAGSYGVTGLIYDTVWSGYLATGGDGVFTSVTSSWVQPGVACGSAHTAAAFWVGLDGYQPDDTIEQTGTAVDCIGGVAIYRDWYEMYPQAPFYYGATLLPGDSMTATVNYNGTDYVLTLTDSTQGWTKTTTQYGDAERSTAEVIVEEPGYPLATFGKVTFKGTYINGAPLLNSTLTQIDMEYPPNSGSVLDYTSGITNRTDFSVTEPGYGP